MQRKVYQILNERFCLKEDLTIEESENVQNLLNQFYLADEGAEITGMLDVRKFLSMVLEPLDYKPEIESFDFGKAKESVAVEVIKDFFLKRFRSTMNTTEYFRSLMKEFNLPSINSTA